VAGIRSPGAVAGVTRRAVDSRAPAEGAGHARARASGEPPISSGAPFWLALEPDPVLCFLHAPPAGSPPSTAVVIVPPFGWDEMCSYRGRRAWASVLATAGHPTLRLDLPGTGDSGGTPRDPDRLDVWTRAVVTAVAWLRERTGAPRVTAAGIGLGGMLAYRAMALGAPIDDLVLWDVPARGRNLVRTLRAQSAMIAGRHPADVKAGKPLEEDAFAATGFLVSGETRRALEKLDLTELTPPADPGRRALLLGRDAMAPDQRLRAHLENSGVEVTIAEGRGYEALMAPPQESRSPAHVIAVTRDWLAGQPAAGRDSVAAESYSQLGRDTVVLRVGDALVRERPLVLQTPYGEVVSILSEPAGVPAAGVCAVLLNAGALRRTGPNRMWVELARGWAARGVPTVRADLEAIGDSDGAERAYPCDADLYVRELLDQTSEVLDGLERAGLPNRFMLAGLCSGAYWSLHTALRDRRVLGALMVNLYPMSWSDQLDSEWRTRKVISSLRGRAWRRLVRRDVNRAELREALRNIAPGRLLATGRGAAEAAHLASVDRVLDALRDQGTEALLLLGRDEPLTAQFKRERRHERIGEWPNVTVEDIPSGDHLFRALWVQQSVKQSLDRGLERTLEAAGRA
jgi:pimeloyl-ACP methyl ester carboxylesterase